MIKQAEYIARMEALQKAAGRSGLDAFLVSAQESIYYLTGITYHPLERPFFILVRPAADPVLLAPALETDHLRAAPNVDTVHRYWDYPSPPGQGWPERLLELLEGVAALGVEPSLIREVSDVLTPLAPRTLPLVEELRLVKSPAEVDMIRRAARYSDMAVDKVIRASYYGVSEVELFSQGRPVQMDIIRNTEYDVLNTQVLAAAWPAPLSAQPHGVPTIHHFLQEGPHIALGFLRVNGYAAECERTYFLAPPNGIMRDAFRAMTRARELAMALVRPGSACAGIDAAAHDFLCREGYGEFLLHRTGHGFGLGNHEGPWVARGSEEVLAPNMVVSVEPGIYLPEVGGIRHSDTILVTQTGHEVLNRYPTDLDSLTVLGRNTAARIKGAVIRRLTGVGRGRGGA